MSAVKVSPGSTGECGRLTMSVADDGAVNVGVCRRVKVIGSDDSTVVPLYLTRTVALTWTSAASENQLEDTVCWQSAVPWLELDPGRPQFDVAVLDVARFSRKSCTLNPDRRICTRPTASRSW